MSSAALPLRSVARRAAMAAVLAVLALGTGSVGSVVAANNVHFVVFANDCQFGGTGAGVRKSVKVEWRDDDGNLKSKHQVTSSSNGGFVTRCEPGEFIEFNDELRVYTGGAWRSFTVPRVRMSVLSLTDEVAGDVVPDPSTGAMLVNVVTLNGGFSPTSATSHASWAPVRDDHSFWTFDWDVAPDIMSWDEVYAVWFSDRGDQFIKFALAPGFRAWIRQPFIDFVGQPPDTISADLEDSNGVGVGRISGGIFDQSGQYHGTFVDSFGTPVRIRPTFKVYAPLGYARTIVPDITAVINKATDRVTVDCGFDGPGSSGVLVTAHNRDFTKSGARAGFQDNASTAVANFATSPAVNISAGDKVDVQCKVASSGDIFARTFTVP